MMWRLKYMTDKNLTFMRYRVNMINFIGESANAVLVGIEGKQAFWLDKKYIFKCDYCLKANISLVKEWEYRIVDLNDSKKYKLVKVDVLVDYFNKMQKNFFDTVKK